MWRFVTRFTVFDLFVGIVDNCITGVPFPPFLRRVYEDDATLSNTLSPLSQQDVSDYLIDPSQIPIHPSLSSPKRNT